MTQPTTPTFASTFGAFLISAFLDTFLYGIAMVLLMQYFYYGFRDTWAVKLMVASLGFLTTLSIIFFDSMFYKYFITYFGIYLDYLPWEAFVQYCPIFIIAFITQTFYVTRIWTLSRSKAQRYGFTVPIMFFSFSGLATAITDCSLVAKDPTFFHLSNSRDIRSMKTTFCLTAAACDISITVVLWYLLHKSRTGVRSTEHVLNRLIVQAISRGAVTSLVAVIYLALYLSMPENLWYTMALEPIGQHYIISVLSMLNSRRLNYGKGYETDSENLQWSMGLSLTRPPKTQTEVDGGVHISSTVVTWDNAHRPEHDLEAASSDSMKLKEFK